MTKTTPTTKATKIAKPADAQPVAAPQDRIDMNDPHKSGSDAVNDAMKAQA